MAGAERLLQELKKRRRSRHSRGARASSGAAILRRPRSRHNFVDHATVVNGLAVAKAGETHAHLPEIYG